MRVIDMFPDDVTRIAADPTVTLPVSWVPPSPKKELDLAPIPGVKKQKYANANGVVPPCVRCARAKTNTKAEQIARPLRDKGGDPAHGKLLVVMTAYGDGITYVSSKLRAAGWQGEIYFDLVVRCGTGDLKPDQVDACRGHLAFTLAWLKPDKILTCGTYASRAVLGDTIMVYATRGVWQLARLNGKDVPIVSTCATVDAQTNKFYAQAFETEVGMLVHTPWEAIARPSGLAYVVENDNDCSQFNEWLQGAPYITFDCETSGIQFRSGFRIASLAVAKPGSDDAYVFFEALANPVVVWHLTQALKNHKLGGWAVKYDVRSVYCQWGIDLSDNILHDGRLLYKVLNAGFPAELDEVGATLGFGCHKAEAKEALDEAIEHLKDQAEEAYGTRNVDRVKAYAYGLLKTPVMERYVGRDAVIAQRAIEHYLGQADAHEFLGKTYHNIQMPAARKFPRVEMHGMLIDKPRLQLVDQWLTERVNDLTTRLKKPEINIDPDKPDSIRAFFERAGLRAKRLTPKAKAEAMARGYAMGLNGPVVLDSDKRSTDKRALAALRDEHTAIADIIEYRKDSKLLSANVRTIIKYIGDDGCVHPSVLQDAAATGRDSVVDPALHSVPGNTDEGKMFKACFIARPGSKILVLDFNALEVWVAAFRSGDKVMQNILLSGKDFHTETAKGLGLVAWGMESEEVGEHIKAGDERGLRKKAKTTGLATMYGIGPEALAESLGTTKAEGVKLIDAFNGLYQGYNMWTLMQHAYADEHGIAVAMWNNAPSRIRQLWSAGYPDYARRGQAHRRAGNMPIQSEGNDYCQVAGTRVHERLRREKIPAHLLLQQHDSLVIDVREDLVVEVAHMAIAEMTNFNIPLRVKAEYGDNWGEVVKLDL